MYSKEIHQSLAIDTELQKLYFPEENETAEARRLRHQRLTSAVSQADWAAFINLSVSELSTIESIVRSSQHKPRFHKNFGYQPDLVAFQIVLSKMEDPSQWRSQLLAACQKLEHPSAVSYCTDTIREFSKQPDAALDATLFLAEAVCDFLVQNKFDKFATYAPMLDWTVPEVQKELVDSFEFHPRLLKNPSPALTCFATHAEIVQHLSAENRFRLALALHQHPDFEIDQQLPAELEPFTLQAFFRAEPLSQPTEKARRLLSAAAFVVTLQRLQPKSAAFVTTHLLNQAAPELQRHFLQTCNYSSFFLSKNVSCASMLVNQFAHNFPRLSAESQQELLCREDLESALQAAIFSDQLLQEAFDHDFVQLLQGVAEIAAAQGKRLLFSRETFRQLLGRAMQFDFCETQQYLLTNYCTFFAPEWRKVTLPTSIFSAKLCRKPQLDKYLAAGLRRLAAASMVRLSGSSAIELATHALAENYPATLQTLLTTDAFVIPKLNQQPLPSNMSSRILRVSKLFSAFPGIVYSADDFSKMNQTTVQRALALCEDQSTKLSLILSSASADFRQMLTLEDLEKLVGGSFYRRSPKAAKQTAVYLPQSRFSRL